MRTTKLGRERLRLESLEGRNLLSAAPLLEPPYDAAAEVAPVEPGDDGVKVEELDASTPDDAAVCGIVPEEEWFYTCDLVVEEVGDPVVTDAGAEEWIEPELYDVGAEPVDPELIYCTFVADPPGDLEVPVVDDLPVEVIDDLECFPVVGDDIVDPDALMYFTMSPDAPEADLLPLPAVVDTAVSSISMTLTPAAPELPRAPQAGDDSAIAIAMGDGQEPAETPDIAGLVELETPAVEPAADSTPPADNADDEEAEPASTGAVEDNSNDLVVSVDLPY